jgi:NHL repeat
VSAAEIALVAQAPAYRNVALWPQPFPNHWVIGSVTGIAVDALDHIWVVHRGADSLEANEKGMMANPPTSSLCCTAAPFVLEYDATGKLLANWGGAGQGYQWPKSPGGITVDGKGNVWIAAAGLEPPAPSSEARGRAGNTANVDPDTGLPIPAARGRGAAAPPLPIDAHVLKFSATGQFMLQIGASGKIDGPESQTTLNRPAAVAVDDAANEVYVADSGNHRVIVFDAATGSYKRHWGAYGERPTAEGGGPYDPGAPAARQFRDVSCVKISKDGMVYVCDRSSDRIQVFRKDGTFIKEAVIAKETTGATVTGQFGVVSSHGSVWDLAFSNDPRQQNLFVADGQNKIVRILSRDALTQIGTIGSGGRYPGQFLVVSTIASDSKGNLYTGEQHHGKRVQKFIPVR